MLKVTATEVIDYPTMPNEALHPFLNTPEALRFIETMSRSQREEFNGMILPESGEPDYKMQEIFIVTTWTANGDNESLAGHHASRALQSARHFATKTHVPDEHGDTVATQHAYYPLMDTPKCPDVARLHWDQESRFRRGIGIVLSRALGEESFELPPLERGVSVSESNQYFARHIGAVLLTNTVSTVGDMVIGSGYRIDVPITATDQA